MYTFWHYVLFSYQDSSPLAKYSIQDVADLCDWMISLVSTTVLDALYMEKPVAIFEEGSRSLILYRGLGA